MLPKKEEGHPEHTFIEAKDLRLQFSQYPHLLSNAEHILKSCSIYFNLKKGKNTIMIKVPSSTDYQNWMFTFIPLSMDGLEFSIE